MQRPLGRGNHRRWPGAAGDHGDVVGDLHRLEDRATVGPVVERLGAGEVRAARRAEEQASRRRGRARRRRPGRSRRARERRWRGGWRRRWCPARTARTAPSGISAGDVPLAITARDVVGWVGRELVRRSVGLGHHHDLVGRHRDAVGQRRGARGSPPRGPSRRCRPRRASSPPRCRTRGPRAPGRTRRRARRVATSRRAAGARSRAGSGGSARGRRAPAPATRSPSSPCGCRERGGVVHVDRARPGSTRGARARRPTAAGRVGEHPRRAPWARRNRRR